MIFLGRLLTKRLFIFGARAFLVILCLRWNRPSQPLVPGLTATSIGVKILADDSLKIYAPFGLEDLMIMKLRHNPTRITLELYRRRIADKRPSQRWPRIQIIH